MFDPTAYGLKRSPIYALSVPLNVTYIGDDKYTLVYFLASNKRVRVSLYSVFARNRFASLGRVGTPHGAVQVGLDPEA